MGGYFSKFKHIPIAFKSYFYFSSTKHFDAKSSFALLYPSERSMFKNKNKNINFVNIVQCSCIYDPSILQNACQIWTQVSVIARLTLEFPVTIWQGIQPWNWEVYVLNTPAPHIWKFLHSHCFGHWLKVRVCANILHMPWFKNWIFISLLIVANLWRVERPWTVNRRSTEKTWGMLKGC